MPANQRRNYLINRPFQIRFAFYVCSWMIALSFIYPLIISNLTDYFIRVLATDPHGANVTQILAARNELLWLLMSMQVVFLFFIFAISIFMSHRIAGPLFKLNRAMNVAKEGDLNERLSFRKTDYFQELAVAFNTMMESIQTRQGKASGAIRKAIPQLEALSAKSEVEVRKELDSVVEFLKKSQG